MIRRGNMKLGIHVESIVTWPSQDVVPLGVGSITGSSWFIYQRYTISRQASLSLKVVSCNWYFLVLADHFVYLL